MTGSVTSTWPSAAPPPRATSPWITWKPPRRISITPAKRTQLVQPWAAGRSGPSPGTTGGGVAVRSCRICGSGREDAGTGVATRPGEDAARVPVPPRGDGHRCRQRSAVVALELAPVDDDRVDHDDVERDQDDRPHGVGGDERQVHQGA